MSAKHQGHKGSLTTYVVGVVLSIILTIIPFYMVMNHSLSVGYLMAVVWVLAVIQIAIQARFFLHLDRYSEGGWNLLSLWFTIMVVGIIVVGSLWIMTHLNMNTMSMPMNHS